MTFLKFSAVGIVSAATLCASAQAHTSFMYPNTFITTEGSQVTIQASFSEDPFVPEMAVLSDDYHVILPDGSRDDFKTLTKLRQVVVLESDLDTEGTYRFTTGVRMGRKSD